MSRTTFAYEETQSYLATSGRNALVEAYLVQYLLVCFYSEIEERIKEVIESRIREINDPKVASFIIKTSQGMIRRVKKAEINDILTKFDCGEGDIISELLSDMNLQPYFDAITNRHLVSHGQGVSMTLDYFGMAIPCGEAILQKITETLANN